MIGLEHLLDGLDARMGRVVVHLPVKGIAAHVGCASRSFTRGRARRAEHV